MTTTDLIRKLSAPIGISGNELAIQKLLLDILKGFCQKVYTDNKGNVIANVFSKKENAPTILLEAHMDEIGLMVSGITEYGSLLFKEVGGFDSKILPGSEVTVHSDSGNFFGVIGAVPPHLSGNDDNSIKIDELCIDIGFSKEESEKKIQIGDFVSFNSSFKELGKGFILGRCIDNRGGVCSIIEAVKDLTHCDVNVSLLFSVREEVYTSGVKSAVSTINPDYIICVDVCHGITNDNKESAFPCGGGPVVSMGPNLHPLLTKKIIDTANKNSINIGIDVDNGNTGTSAWEMQVSNNGYGVSLISIPLKYMHTNGEVAAIKDIEETAKLISLFLSDFKGGDDLCF